MNDDWIDKNEMNNLISGINPKPPQQQRSVAGPVYNNDLFYDIQKPVRQQQPQVQHPHQSPPQTSIPAYQNVPQQHPAPLQMQVPQPAYTQAQGSPFTLDDEALDPETRIAQLEMMLAELRQAQPLPPVEEPAVATEPPVTEPVAIEGQEAVNDDDIESRPETPCSDRIPLTVEIDRYLSLKGRLASLAGILTEYLEMEQMMVVDQNGLSLFETQAVSAVEGKVDQYLQKMRSVYAVDKNDHRNHSSSQLATSDGKWLLLLLTDSKGIERKYTLKCLLPTPLDPPEIYTLIELLNETMRPKVG